jgi:hypothetical protein
MCLFIIVSMFYEDDQIWLQATSKIPPKITCYMMKMFKIIVWSVWWAETWGVQIAAELLKHSSD